MLPKKEWSGSHFLKYNWIIRGSIFSKLILPLIPTFLVWNVFFFFFLLLLSPLFFLHWFNQSILWSECKAVKLFPVRQLGPALALTIRRRDCSRQRLPAWEQLHNVAGLDNPKTAEKRERINKKQNKIGKGRSWSSIILRKFYSNKEINFPTRKMGPRWHCQVV